MNTGSSSYREVNDQHPLNIPKEFMCKLLLKLPDLQELLWHVIPSTAEITKLRSMEVSEFHCPWILQGTSIYGLAKLFHKY